MNTKKIKRLLVAIITAIGLPMCGGAAVGRLTSRQIRISRPH